MGYGFGGIFFEGRVLEVFERRRRGSARGGVLTGCGVVDPRVLPCFGGAIGTLFCVLALSS